MKRNTYWHGSPRCWPHRGPMEPKGLWPFVCRKALWARRSKGIGTWSMQDSLWWPLQADQAISWQGKCYAKWWNRCCPLLSPSNVSCPFLLIITKFCIHCLSVLHGFNNWHGNSFNGKENQLQHRLGLSISDRGALLCDAWSGSFKKTEGLEMRRCLVQSRAGKIWSVGCYVNLGDFLIVGACGRFHGEIPCWDSITVKRYYDIFMFLGSVFCLQPDSMLTPQGFDNE